MKRDEQGIALVITLFLMATLSALAVSMMFLAQTETASSRNYRTMSQARYAAEAGVHSMVNYLMGTAYSAVAPGSPFTGYGTTRSPVTCTSGCTHTTANSCDGSTIANAVSTGCIVVGYSTATTNNPASTMYTSATGTLAVNSSGTTSNAAAGTVTYGAVAILMSMKSVVPYGSTGSTVIQTWQIISDGTVPPSTAAIVEVSGALEREYGTAQTFAVFATGTGCGAIDLSGNVSTASYDGSTVATSGGNVGTNGNMHIQGHVDVHGSLSSPRTGIGTCTNGSNMTALTEGGAASVDGNNLIQLPQALNFPTPSLPSPMPPTSSMSASAATCITLVALNATTNPGTTCVYSGGTATVTPGSTSAGVLMGNISGNWTLNAGKYSINSVGSGNLGTAGSGQVAINLAGKNSDGSQMANPFNLNGQAVVNTSMDASKLEVLYAGTGSFDMTGGSNASLLLYAPNANVTTHGNADIYGSLLVASVTSAGTPRFIYDTRLQKEIVTLGNFMLTSFSWKKY